MLNGTGNWRCRLYTDGMNPQDKKKWQAEYYAKWEALETIRARELAALTDEEAFRIMKTLNVPGTPCRERPDWSGLVEQQAILHRRRSKP